MIVDGLLTFPVLGTNNGKYLACDLWSTNTRRARFYGKNAHKLMRDILGTGATIFLSAQSRFYHSFEERIATGPGCCLFLHLPIYSTCDTLPKRHQPVSHIIIWSSGHSLTRCRRQAIQPLKPGSRDLRWNLEFQVSFNGLLLRDSGHKQRA